MISPSEILGIASDSTLEQIEAAFQEKSEYWRRLQSNSQRSAEAKAMLEQVIVAYDFLRTQAQSTASGLEYREPRSFSGQTGGTPMDKDSCPHCGHKGNPPDARFCIECREKLFQICLSCNRELPWHQKNCHLCGVDIMEVQQAKEVQRQQKELEKRNKQEAQLAEIDQQLKNLNILETRFRTPMVGDHFVLQWPFPKKEILVWAEKDGLGCGRQLKQLVIVLVVITVIVGLLSFLPENLLDFTTLLCVLLPLTIVLILVILFVAQYYMIYQPAALNAVFKERASLEQQRKKVMDHLR